MNNKIYLLHHNQELAAPANLKVTYTYFELGIDSQR